MKKLPLDDILDHINAGILVIDQNYLIHFANNWMKAYTQYGQLEGAHVQDVFEFQNDEFLRLQRKVQTALQLNAPSFLSAELDNYLLPIKNTKVFGPTYTKMQQEASIMPFVESEGLVLIMLYDQTDLMMSKQEIINQSEMVKKTLSELQSAHTRLEAQTRIIEKHTNYDDLTGLPNSTLVKDRLSNAIHTAQQSDLKVGVLYIDLDRFKPVNDRYGPSVGDQLLIDVGQKLQSLISPKDTLARLSADEFVMIITQVSQVDYIATLAERVVSAVEKPWSINDETLFISASIGISVFPNDGHNFDDLIKHADLAMAIAKNEARGSFKFFTDSLDKELKDALLLESELIKAINIQAFEVYFQPKYHCDGTTEARLVGAEALIRWIHPSMGFISPDSFIGLAEQKGLITLITQQVIEQTLTMLQTLATYDKNIPISINISALDLADPYFCQNLFAQLEKAQLSNQMIELEVTERMAMVSQQQNFAQLETCRHEGIKISLDDFGTGYSSLSYLAKMPIDVLKIDKSFIALYQTGHQYQVLLKSIIELARVFDYQVLAEGVETEQDMNMLTELGCFNFQGYFFSRPLTKEDFLSLCLK